LKQGDNVAVRDNLLVGSLKRVWPPRWLNDEVINEYMKLLNKNNKTTVCLQTFFFTKLEQSPGASSRMLVKAVRNQNLDPSAVECLLMPVNKNQLHWILFAVLPSHRTVMVLDSMRKPVGAYNVDLNLLKEACAKMWPQAETWETRCCEQNP
jgi:Ulp1 family protease